jgi:hypothetical protein
VGVAGLAATDCPVERTNAVTPAAVPKMLTAAPPTMQMIDLGLRRHVAMLHVLG